MTSEIVTSPAGESIEIVDDDDWLVTAGAEDDKGLRAWNGGTKRFAIAELWLHGSATDDKSGRAASVLWDRMRETFGPDEVTSNPNSFSMLVRDSINAAAFDNDTRAKRTYAIRLVALPRRWYDKLMVMIDELDDSPILPDEVPIPNQGLVDDITASANGGPITNEPSAPQTDDEFEAMIRDMELDAPTVYETAPPLDLQIASQVAMSLLTTVVEIISAGSAASVDEKVRKLQGDLNDVMGKLSSRLEDNDRMRRQLRQAGDEINALRHERDGLRSRLRATEANLTAALKGDAVQAINGEIQRRVNQIMRTPPTTPKGNDA